MRLYNGSSVLPIMALGGKHNRVPVPTVSFASGDIFSFARRFCARVCREAPHGGLPGRLTPG